eukprot:15477597-Alexandrium_andersonii.AAC.1
MQGGIGCTEVAPPPTLRGFSRASWRRWRAEEPPRDRVGHLEARHGVPPHAPAMDLLCRWAPD